MILTIIGILSAVLFIAGGIPYLVDSINAKTKPHRVTWGMVFLMNSIGFANQYASGARNSLWLFAAGALMTGAIFIVSIFKGVGGGTKADLVCLTISLLGVVLWIILKSPVYSILASVIADVFILYPTFKKADTHPETETRITWLIGTISALMATISVGELNWRLLILPLWSTALQAYMVYLLYIKHHHNESLKT